jgi:hypothetical protein
MEDDRVAILEAQLSQAKLIAEEADKKYEEVRPNVFKLPYYRHFEGMPNRHPNLRVMRDS